MIRVLIAEDSPLIAALLRAHLESEPGIQVVGVAKNGAEAVKMAQSLKPSLVTMDLHMPVMDGVEATKKIMAYSPTPILILTSSVAKGKRSGELFQALSYGALEVMEKKGFETQGGAPTERAALLEKVKSLSRVRVITHILAKLEHRTPFKARPAAQRLAEQRKAVGIVASTGGPQALLDILKALPKDLNAPIFVVQHISPGFVDSFGDWLAEQIELRVKVAQEGELCQAGVVYIAPNDFHMKVTAGGRISLSQEDPVCRERPSGTVLLASIARSYGEDALGILLTGMGRDGAEGLKQLREAGGRTIAQDEATSVIYGMPKAAVELGAADEVLALDNIPERILQWAGERS